MVSSNLEDVAANQRRTALHSKWLLFNSAPAAVFDRPLTAGGGIAIDDVLHIAEIPYESGSLRCRYSRVLSENGSQWVRHGLFTAFHENGQRASEGLYVHGLETGVWRDFHDNGQLAAEGEYVAGKEHGVWRHWDPEGREEESTRYEHGEEAAS